MEACPGSHILYYVNPFVRGTPTLAGLRFSSNVVHGIEIAVFVAKRDPVASDFDRIPSLQGSGFRKTACYGPAYIFVGVNQALHDDRRRQPFPPDPPEMAPNGDSGGIRLKARVKLATYRPRTRLGRPSAPFRRETRPGQASVGPRYPSWLQRPPETGADSAQAVAVAQQRRESTLPAMARLVFSLASIRPSTTTGDGNHSRPTRREWLQTPIPAVFGWNRVSNEARRGPEPDRDDLAPLFAVKRAQGKPASAPDTRPGPSAHPKPAQIQPRPGIRRRNWRYIDHDGQQTPFAGGTSLLCEIGCCPVLPPAAVQGRFCPCWRRKPLAAVGGFRRHKAPAGEELRRFSEFSSK